MLQSKPDVISPGDSKQAAFYIDRAIIGATPAFGMHPDTMNQEDYIFHLASPG